MQRPLEGVNPILFSTTGIESSKVRHWLIHTYYKLFSFISNFKSFLEKQGPVEQIIISSICKWSSRWASIDMDTSKVRYYSNTWFLCPYFRESSESESTDWINVSYVPEFKFPSDKKTIEGDSGLDSELLHFYGTYKIIVLIRML